MLRAAEKSPIVPMNSSTGMPLSTWTFLKTSSTICGFCPDAACCPLAASATPIIHTTVMTTTLIDGLDHSFIYFPFAVAACGASDVGGDGVEDGDGAGTESRPSPHAAVNASVLPAASAAGRRLRATLCRIGAVHRRAGARRSQKQLAAVRERHVAAVGAQLRMIARLIAVDDDLGARLQRVLGDAAAEQRVRRPAFDHPLFLGPVGLRDLDVDPRVRIHPLDLRDRSLQQDRPV